MYIGWCDGVQVHDHNMVHTTCRAPRAETPAVWARSLGAPQARITGPRTEAHQYDRNRTTEERRLHYVTPDLYTSGCGSSWVHGFTHRYSTLPLNGWKPRRVCGVETKGLSELFMCRTW